MGSKKRRYVRYSSFFSIIQNISELTGLWDTPTIFDQRFCVLGKANPASMGISSDKLKHNSDKKLSSSTNDSSHKGSNKTSTKFDTNRKRKSSSSSPFNTKNAKS